MTKQEFASGIAILSACNMPPLDETAMQVWEKILIHLPADAYEKAVMELCAESTNWNYGANIPAIIRETTLKHKRILDAEQKRIERERFEVKFQLEEGRGPYTPEEIAHKVNFKFPELKKLLKGSVRVKQTAKDVEVSIIGWVNLHGGMAKKIHVAGVPIKGDTGRRRKNPDMAGFSDLVILWKGLFIACEVKRPGDRQRQKQEDFQFEVERAQGVYMIVKDLEDFIHQMRERRLLMRGC